MFLGDKQHVKNSPGVPLRHPVAIPAMLPGRQRADARGQVLGGGVHGIRRARVLQRRGHSGEGGCQASRPGQGKPSPLVMFVGCCEFYKPNHSFINPTIVL